MNDPTIEQRRAAIRERVAALADGGKVTPSKVDELQRRIEFADNPDKLQMLEWDVRDLENPPSPPRAVRHSAMPVDPPSPWR
jgi:hypothetical protein